MSLSPLAFASPDAFAPSLLLRDRAVPHRYVTVDRWRSEEDYARFRQRFAEDYRALDERCRELTLHERALGTYATTDSPR